MKTGSEFCCDEHAEQYKRETVGRLLEYAEPLHPSLVDPMHRLAILAGEKPASEEEPSWEIQEFVALTLRHRTTPRVPVAASSPRPPRLHRPRGGDVQPRQIWNPLLVHVLPREGPWSGWFPAEPEPRIPAGRSLSDLSGHRQPAAPRAEAGSGLRRRSARGLPAAPPARCAGVEPSGAAPLGRRSVPAPVPLGLPRTRAVSPGQVRYPGPTPSARRFSPALGFLSVSAGLAAAPADSVAFAVEGVVPTAVPPLPIWLQALPFAPLRRTTPSFFPLAAAPRVGPNGHPHASPVVDLRTGWELPLRLPELPPARKFGRLGRAAAPSLVGETRLLDAVPVPAAAHYPLPPARQPLPSPAIPRAVTPVEGPVAGLETFASSHTLVPAAMAVPALAASALAGRRLDLAPAVERLVPAVWRPASNTWSPAAGLALLAPAGSPFWSAPAEAVSQPLSPRGLSPWLTATRLLTGSSCAWRVAGESTRKPAARSAPVNRAVAGEALRLTATPADMLVSRVQAPAVAQPPVTAPCGVARLQPRRVALTLPPSGNLASVMPSSAVAAVTAPAAAGAIMNLSRAVATCNPETPPFLEVSCTVSPATLTAVPATGATPSPAPDPRPLLDLVQPSPALAGVASVEPTVPASTRLQAAAYPPLPVPELALELAALHSPLSPAAPLAPALPVEISPLLARSQAALPVTDLVVDPSPLPGAPPPHPISQPEVEATLPSVPAEPLVSLTLPPLAIELRRREVPPPLPARRTARIADRVGAEAAFGPGRRAPAPAPTNVPALLAPLPRSLRPPASSSLRPLHIPFAPRAGDLPAAEPVPRLEVSPASKPTLRPVPVSPLTEAAAVREALDTAQGTGPSRLAILSRAALVFWHDAVVPFLATRRGKFATAAVFSVLSLFLGLRTPNGPLRGVARAAVLPLAERSYFLSEEDFASGFKAWSSPALFRLQDNGLVEIREGLTLYQPSLRRVDYEFSFAGAIRRGALGWVVRASDPSNYYACKLAWRGKGKEKRSVLVRNTVVNDAPAAPEKVVALPFELEENKVYNLMLTVHGDRVSTLIDGRGVDSFTDTRLPTGGIGFLAGPGEQALVHSVAISGNDDPAGRSLAWMLGFGRFLGGKVFGS